MISHIYWKDDSLYLLDQRAVPFKETYVECRTLKDVIHAINAMVIRGAPLIGVVAAYGVALGMAERVTRGKDTGDRELNAICDRLARTRPTAVNLFWALQRMKSAYSRYKGEENIVGLLIDEAITIHAEDIENNRMLSLYGAELIDDGDVILTHCNAGALATGGYGTALGVIRAAHEEGKDIRVIATETRPYLQGARLTVWELHQEGIPVELVPDNHAGFLCYNGEIDKVVVGADRIAANGDTANKIGTYMIALCARQHETPFYIAAPVSTFDVTINNGTGIPIEEREGTEVTRIRKTPLTLEGVKARYYSFDITPERYISGFITERGVIEKPFKKYIKMLFS